MLPELVEVIPMPPPPAPLEPPAPPPAPPKPPAPDEALLDATSPHEPPTDEEPAELELLVVLPASEVTHAQNSVTSAVGITVT